MEPFTLWNSWFSEDNRHHQLPELLFDALPWTPSTPSFPTLSLSRLRFHVLHAVLIVLLVLVIMLFLSFCSPLRPSCPHCLCHYAVLLSNQSIPTSCFLFTVLFRHSSCYMTSFFLSKSQMWLSIKSFFYWKFELCGWFSSSSYNASLINLLVDFLYSSIMFGRKNTIFWMFMSS